jgi:hypothetical protein
VWLDNPDPSLLQHNRAVAKRFFSLLDLPARLQALLTGFVLPAAPAGSSARGVATRSATGVS